MLVYVHPLQRHVAHIKPASLISSVSKLLSAPTVSWPPQPARTVSTLQTSLIASTMDHKSSKLSLTSQPARMVATLQPSVIASTLDNHLILPARFASKSQGDFASNKPGMSVALVGGASQFGSILALLLKQSPLLDVLVMADVGDNTCGVAMDVSHVDTRCRMQAYTGDARLGEALRGTKIVLICTGVGGAGAKSDEELFKTNAPIIKRIAECFAVCSPCALLGVLTPPINSMVPLVSEVLKQHGVYDPSRVFGITCVDMVRANTFVAEAMCADPDKINVPVVGGHSISTMVPVLSQTKPCATLTRDQICEIYAMTKKSDLWVSELKDCEMGALLAPAHAAARFTKNLMRALCGEKDVTDCAYISSKMTPPADYCVMPVELGKNGIAKGRLPKLCGHERDYLDLALIDLVPQIKRGEEYVKKEKEKEC